MHGFDDLFRAAAIKLRGMWRFRWLGLAIAWAVAAVGIGALLAMPARYEASARIFVNTDSILKPLMTGLTVQPNDDQRIIMLSRVVISRPNVEKLVKTVGLDSEARNREERERVVDVVTKNLEFKGAGRDNLYTLSFRDTDPARAKKAIELLASMFIESSRGGRSKDTEAAKAFIDEQIAAYDKKLQEAENRLKEFRLKYLGMTPGDGKDYFMRMSETEKTLAQARLELREAERARDAFRKGLASESAEPGAPLPASNPLVIDMDARIDLKRRELDTLLQRFTDSHPDVVGARRVIQDLEEQRAQLVRSARSAPGGAVAIPTARSPIAGLSASESLKVSLAQAEASVASLTTRVAEYTDRYNRLRASAALVPQLEAEYTQLNRDYDVNKKNYESLVARRESANISGDMQSVAGISDFRLVDPPRVSPRPVSPKTAILFPVLLVFALGAGFAAAYIAAEARPTVMDSRTLREVTGLPLLGAVSMITGEAARLAARRSTMRFVGGAAALVAVFVVSFVSMELLTVRYV